MKSFYMFKKEDTYYAYDPYYRELYELAIHPVNYFESQYYISIHNNLEEIKEILNGYHLSYREQFKIVKFSFEINETVINL